MSTQEATVNKMEHGRKMLDQRTNSMKIRRLHNKMVKNTQDHAYDEQVSPRITVSSAQSGRTSPYFELCDEAFTE